MTVKRTVLFGLAAVAAVMVALVVASGVGRPVMMFVYVLYEAVFPATISWDSKSAYVKCESAIADPREWPKAPNEACAAKHLCANEATLSDRQSKALAEAVRRTPGCPEL